ncbi:hypothetical protein [Streptomyces rubellomurinus]|uniref:Uncharacterized protein n=1 Tax=Streptomyces sp. Y1 TaxID=3238634 RepID=A0AB39TST6_9ACTN|nr:hypothetical protein [Streptomyces rubellomurinus]
MNQNTAPSCLRPTEQDGTVEAMDSLELEFREWLEQNDPGELSALRSLDGGHAGGCG